MDNKQITLLIHIREEDGVYHASIPSLNLITEGEGTTKEEAETKLYQKITKESERFGKILKKAAEQYNEMTVFNFTFKKIENEQ